MEDFPTITETYSVFNFKVKDFSCKVDFEIEPTEIYVESRDMRIGYPLLLKFRANKITKQVVGITTFQDGVKTEDTHFVEILRKPNNDVQIGCLSLTDIEFNQFLYLIKQKKNEYIREKSKISI